MISSEQVSDKQALWCDGPPGVSVLPDTTPAGSLILGLVLPYADMDERRLHLLTRILCAPFVNVD